MTKVIKNSVIRALVLLESVVYRQFAVRVKESVPHGFKSHILLLRLTGWWPLKTDSRWYNSLTIASVFLIGISPSLLQTAILFYANTMEEAMDRLFLGLNCWMTVLKVCTIYRRRDCIRQLFCIQAHLSPHTGRNRCAQMNFYLHVAIFTVYFSTYCTFVMQSVVAKPEDRILLSTSPFPFTLAGNEVVCWTVLVYQIISVAGLIAWVALADSFYMAFMNIACGYLEAFEEKLKVLGIRSADKEIVDLHFYKDLMECCQMYEDCLRCVTCFFHFRNNNR